ncbi:helix-turn-helix transcriptional regulator [Leptothoe sp. LEGE 181152]|nr:helix-turn-helix transcriptional regulator [Leptothoe sp. LEGE 181152]
MQDVSGMISKKSDEASPVIGFVELRKEKGVTQRQVAEALELSERTIIDWESGKRTPKLYVWQVKALCELLSVSIFDMPNSFAKEGVVTQKNAGA